MTPNKDETTPKYVFLSPHSQYEMIYPYSPHMDRTPQSHGFLTGKPNMITPPQ